MRGDLWQRKIDRAEELASRYAFAAEILAFFSAISRFQGKFYGEIEGTRVVREISAVENPFGQTLDRELARRFRPFLAVVERSGPGKLRESAREIGARNENAHLELLASFWDGNSVAAAQTNDFFSRSFLQPFAVAVRTRANLRWNGPTAFVCPFCKRKPGVGVLRPLGDGGQRSLICSFCLGEWEFRRIVCPGCGEGDPAKLPVYTAEQLEHVRVDACDACKSYIKTVDLTKSGLGEPVVDEIASVPLDFWAHERGYSKLQVNLMQL
jgi:formate dehydrogenase maturation protein FdhE